MAEGEREIGRGKRLALGGHRARDHQGSRPGLELVMMKGCSEPPILLDQRRFGAGTDDDFSDPFLSESVGMPEGVTGTRLRDDWRPVAYGIDLLISRFGGLDILEA